MRPLLPPLLLLTACSGGLAVPAANLELAEQEITFEQVQFGRVAERTVRLTNTGTARARGVLRLTEPFLLDTDAVTLSADQGTELTVLYLPTSYDPAEGTLTVRLDGRELSVSVRASVNPDFDADGELAEGAGGQDCDDTRADVGPDQPEVCDGVDNDCNGRRDDDAVDAGTWYVDADGDGFGDPEQPVQACSQPGNTSAQAGDCDDGDRLVAPGLPERSDGIDQDCDGRVDEHLLVDGALILTELHPGAADVPPYVELLVGDVPAPVYLQGLQVGLDGTTTTLDGDDQAHPAGSVLLLCGQDSPGTVDDQACDGRLPDASVDAGLVQLTSEVVVDTVDASALVFDLDRSLELESDALDAASNDLAASWCVATTALGTGSGSPGSVDDHCSGASE